MAPRVQIVRYDPLLTSDRDWSAHIREPDGDLDIEIAFEKGDFHVGITSPQGSDRSVRPRPVQIRAFADETPPDPIDPPLDPPLDPPDRPLLPSPAQARRFTGHFLAAGPRRWMFPAHPPDVRAALLQTYAGTHLPFALYGAYREDRVDLRDRLDVAATILDEVLAAGKIPVLFLLTDLPDQQVWTVSGLSHWLDRVLPWLADWIARRQPPTGAGVLPVCLGWEIQQVRTTTGLLLSGQIQLDLLARIRHALPPGTIRLCYHPAPHRSCPEDEVTVAGWPSAWPGEETLDSYAWLRHAASVGLQTILLNVAAMPEDRVKEILLRGDPPDFDPQPHTEGLIHRHGYLARYAWAGLECVLFEMTTPGDEARWARLQAWAATEPRLAGWC